jgi:lactam utilization protein B
MVGMRNGTPQGIRRDLNADLGSFGAYTMGAADHHLGVARLPWRRSTHAQDEMADRICGGFGRRAIQGESPEDIEAILIYQIGAIQAMARAAGLPVTHFKAHGALGNAAAVDAELAMACARAVKATDPDMLFLVMPGNEMEKAGAAMGLRLVREAYADRAYDDDANLVSRKIEGAVIHDPQMAAQRVVRWWRSRPSPASAARRFRCRSKRSACTATILPPSKWPAASAAPWSRPASRSGR